MEREIGELQKIIIQNDEDDYGRDLEVQRLRNRVQMASFQYNTSYLHWPGEQGCCKIHSLKAGFILCEHAARVSVSAIHN